MAGVPVERLEGAILTVVMPDLRAVVGEDVGLAVPMREASGHLVHPGVRVDVNHVRFLDARKTLPPGLESFEKRGIRVTLNAVRRRT